MKPIFKDISKFSVDLVAEFLKKNYNHDISSIRTEAKWCGVEKVIAIPYYFADGTKTVLLRTYGGNHDKFFKQIGCSSIPQANTDIDFELIEMLEHKYGVEIYNASINQGD